MTADTDLMCDVDLEAKTLTLRQSAVQSFLDCRRRFLYNYIRGLEPEYPSGDRPFTNADVGSAFHAGIGAYYLDEDPVPAINEWLRDNFTDLSDEKVVKGARMAEVMTLGHIDDLERGGHDLGETTLHVEHDVAATFPVGDWRVTVTGRIDRLIEIEDVGLVLDDWKSTDKLASTLDYIQQLGRYAVILRLMGLKVARVRSTQVKRVLRQGEGPFFSRPWVPLNEEAYTSHYANLVAQLRDLTRTIETEDYYERVSTECGWKCNVQDLCRALQQGDDAEQIVDLHYRLKTA